MKTTSVALVLCALTFTNCQNGKYDSQNLIAPFGKTVEGKGPVQEKTFSGNFDELKVSASIYAEVVKSDQEKVVISAPADLMEHILVDNVGGKLHIHFKPGVNIRYNGQVKATVYAKDFNKVSANSSAEIVLKDKFLSEQMQVDVSSSGSVKGNLEANDFEIEASSSGGFTGKIWAINLDAEVSSSADVNISGKAKKADLQASSSGSIQAQNLVAEDAELDASSSGSITVGVASSLSAAASSSGDIKVLRKGNLKTEQSKESSGGSISIQ